MNQARGALVYYQWTFSIDVIGGMQVNLLEK